MARRMMYIFFSLSAMILGLPNRGNADDIAIYLEATLGTIHTLSLDFSRTSSELPLENMKGKVIAVLQSGRIIRLRSRFEWSLGADEFIVNNGKHIDYRGKSRTYTVNSELATPAALGNPLLHALWTTRVKDKPYFGDILTSLREQSYRKESVTPPTKFANAVFYSTKYDNTVQLLGFSPSHNYLPCYRKLTPTGLETWVEESVDSFTEIGKGLFFPTVIIRKAPHPQTKIENSTKTVFSNVRINNPIPESAFDIKYSEGDHVVDTIAKQVYIADKDGVLRDDKKMQIFDYGTRRDSTAGELITTSAGRWNPYWLVVCIVVVFLTIALAWSVVVRSRKKGLNHA